MKEYINRHPFQKAFFLGFLTAFCLFIPYLVVDKGFFTYAGDFNSQQIPFYMYMNKMVKSGSLGWGWAIDLGSSVVNSFSFYLLGSPFFWLSCLFPYKAVPYIMPYLLMLKFAVGNMGAFGYLRRYAKNDNYAMIGAAMYTFSGFSIYNIFFNHFIESVVFFPYLLWALDEFVYNKRKGVFPLIVALNLVNNYFFFIGQVVFLFIYFGCKIRTKEYRISKKEFFNLAFESLTGCFMGIILFIPSVVSVMKNPRVTSALEGFGIWLYSNVQQYFAILSSALLPPDPPYLPSLFTEGAIKWTSMSAFMALGGIFGLFVFTRYRKRSSFYKVFIISIVCAFIPVLNSMFYAFNSSYYARWYYMPLLMLAAMNMQSFAMEKQQIYHGLKYTAVLTAVLLPFALTPVMKDERLSIGLADQPAIFWMNIIIAFLSLYLAYFIVSCYQDSKYTQRLLQGLLTVTMLYGTLHMGLTKMPQWQADHLYKPQNYDILDSFAFDDEMKNYRMDTYNCYDNLGLFTSVPCVQFFNSTVSPSIMEFYPAVGVKRDVSSKPGRNMYALRSLLSVKYLVMPNWEISNFEQEADLYGYELISSEYPYNIYRNTNFISMGFAYDKYVTYSDLESINAYDRSNILIRALATSEEMIEKYGLPLKKADEEDIYDYSYSTFLTDVMKRKNMSSYHFEMTNSGFECRIILNQPNLVYFSLPYDDGFTAYVNGEEAEIEKVNYAMSAVYVPAGDNEIVFSYKTPYLSTGIMLTAAGWLVYSIYIAYNYKNKKRI
ncbi:MAG: YfhO family protein [Oscillospiraceae bacterium]|nr:YfhO family protein [Oscillospiraceae bacterium]